MRTTKTNAKVMGTKTYTTKQVAEMLGVTVVGLTNYLYNHKELRPTHGSAKRKEWTPEEVYRLMKHRSKTCNCNKPKTEIPTSIIAIPETEFESTAISTNISAPETLITMFDTFLKIEQEEEKSENRAANRKFRYLFDNMTEHDLQEFFKPLTERFKFSYVTKQIKDIQSQTLTCIKNGKLKGLDKYKLTYKAFLHLCKFAAENNCPLNIPQTQLQNT